MAIRARDHFTATERRELGLALTLAIQWQGNLIAAITQDTPATRETLAECERHRRYFELLLSKVARLHA